MNIGFSRCFRFSRRGLALALSCLATLAVIDAAPAQSVGTSFSAGSGQNVADTLSSLTGTTLSNLINKYASASYSILGPYTLKKVTTTELTFEAYPEKPNGTTMSLTGKNVKVKTESGTDSSSSSLSAGVRVLICVKDKEVIIFILSTKTNSSSNR